METTIKRKATVSRLVRVEDTVDVEFEFRKSTWQGLPCVDVHFKGEFCCLDRFDTEQQAKEAIESGDLDEFVSGDEFNDA